MSLFDAAPAPHTDAATPLAERMRPERLEDFLGQEHILGPGKPLRAQIERDQLSSMILWGPPGVGKTTLARIIARLTHGEFVPFSAVLGGIKEIKAVMAEAEKLRRYGRRTILFVDEIHRFNKAQQDAFLPYVERGDIVLIGATTENPSFEVNAALLSRAKVYVLRALALEEIEELLAGAAERMQWKISAELRHQIAVFSGGDARAAYNTLEAAAQTGPEITAQAVEDAIQRKVALYDKAGEQHFNLISALHKSVRASDPDGALYWLGRMLAAGEDRLYLARRLMRMAIEDIGLADPKALEQGVAAMQAVHFLGQPEGDLALGQLAVYLACSPKSDSVYRAMGRVNEDAERTAAEPVPLHLRNAVTGLMSQLGYAQGYERAHQADDAVVGMECLPESLRGKRYYFPTDRGAEKRIAERLQEVEEKKRKLRE